MTDPEEVQPEAEALAVAVAPVAVVEESNKKWYFIHTYSGF